MVFKSNCERYYEIGISAIPIAEGTKRPVVKQWQDFCDVLPEPKIIEQWKNKYGELNIGIALGKLGRKGRLIAIDVDDDSLVEAVTRAVGSVPCAKKGKKGLTIFCIGDPEITNFKIKRTADGKPARVPSVEILASGSQTVIPPSIHPDTGEPYDWIGEDLVWSIRKLPYIHKSCIDEILAHCQGKGEPFTNLNEMVWLGENGGGNTHDMCVTAAAAMVSRDWPDADIHSRIERAKQEACDAAGDTYDWPQSSKVIQEWIDSARTKGMTGSSNTKKKIPPERVMAEWAIDTLGGPELVVCTRGQLRAYQDGYWPTVNIPHILRSMYVVDVTLKEREAKSAVSIVHTMVDNNDFGQTRGLDPKDDPKRQRICLMNGSLNVKTGELEKWDPDHQLIHRLDFEWDDTAKCNLYEKVLAATFSGDQESMDLWDEYCAHTLVDDMTFQKLLFLKGPGGNGKGTLARVLSSMHDPAAVGSVGITDLNDERKRTSLVGKLVNISGEQSRLNLVSDTYLKKITGGDPIDVRKLYGETQNNVNLSVRFLELVNEMPQTSDHSHALRRRIIILNCPNKVTKPDLDLDAKLRQERPGILKRWVAALGRLYARGYFSVPDSAIREVDDYLVENDPVAYWVREETVSDDKSSMSSKQLYSEFREWMSESGFRYPISEVHWGKRLAGLGYPAKNKRVAAGVIRTRPLRLKKPSDRQEF